MSDRAEIVHENFLARVRSASFSARVSDVSLEEAGFRRQRFPACFRSQVLSRQLDRHRPQTAGAGRGLLHDRLVRAMRATPRSPQRFRVDRHGLPALPRCRVPDPAGAAGRARRRSWDMLLSFTASAEDPISGGRHKVLGSKQLFIPPQTSTIASHLPKAVGAAVRIGLAKRIKPEHKQLPDDAVVLCSFGDASPTIRPRKARSTPPAGPLISGLPMPHRFHLRGQWHRHFDPDAGRLDRGEHRGPAGAAVFPLRRARHLLDTYDGACEVADYVRVNPQAGVPAHAHRAALRPCRRRRADSLHDARSRSRRTRRAIRCCTRPRI